MLQLRLRLQRTKNPTKQPYPPPPTVSLARGRVNVVFGSVNVARDHVNKSTFGALGIQAKPNRGC